MRVLLPVLAILMVAPALADEHRDACLTAKCGQAEPDSSKIFERGSFMEQLRRSVLGILTLATGVTVFDGAGAWQVARAQAIARIQARVIAINIPGASAISQVGTFLNNPVPPACAHPIPTLFASFVQPGAVLDPNRILVGSRSNFGAPLAIGVGREGSFLSIDPSGPGVLRVPPDFAQSGVQASTLRGAVQMFSANSPTWLNGVNNPGASTSSYPTPNCLE